MEAINLVRAYRKGANITQSEMAKALGCAEKTYRALENEPRKFTLEQINKFMAVINIYNPDVKAADIFGI